MFHKIKTYLGRQKLQPRSSKFKKNRFGVKINHNQWFKPQYIIGFLTLFLVLIVEGNQNWFSSEMTARMYQPIPATIESPWPWQEKTEIHDLIANIHPNTETDIQSVANYIKTNELDPFLRIKAVHDYVVTKLTYDVAVLETGVRPSQEARDVFKTGQAVCEGYAKLFEAIAKAMGEDVIYLEGDVRREFAPNDVIPLNLKFLDLSYNWTRHAWNAVKIEENWYLVDTTWDDSETSYYTDYLMPPERMMNISHLPDNENWQLSYTPNSPEKFEKQPLLTPDFFKYELELLSALQYNNQVENTGKIRIENKNNSLEIVALYQEIEKDKLLNFGKKEITEESGKCDREKNSPEEITISCQFPKSGVYQVSMLSFDKVNTNQINPIPLGELQFTVSDL
ncbi:transglutaminase domain-containing protein [Crocosphaera sp. Alani8]|uniref:transglutaminase domain-containing protein n=1 Tax=Crocosphaera sp. Alani8 TaxID=3038952 RepID=UPI00313ECCA7